MAEVTRGTKTVTKMVEVEEVVPSDDIVLTLDFREASLIRAMLGSGMDFGPARDEADAIRRALTDVDIRYGNTAFYGDENCVIQTPDEFFEN